MSDLISRSELFNKLATVQTLGEAYGIIQGMPIVDAVPVVRCKDCKHYEWTANRVPEEQTWWCYKHNTEMGNNDYCSYGERDGDHAEGTIQKERS